MKSAHTTEGLPLFGIHLNRRRPIIERQRRDEAIDRVEDRNDSGPNDRAIAELEARLSQLPPMAEVTSDSLLPDLEKFRFSDPRAVGAIMRRAAASGWIKPTDKHRNSTRPGNHCVPRRVYLNTYPEGGTE